MPEPQLPDLDVCERCRPKVRKFLELLLNGGPPKE